MVAHTESYMDVTTISSLLIVLVYCRDLSSVKCFKPSKKITTIPLINIKMSDDISLV